MKDDHGDLKGLDARESAMPQPMPIDGRGDYWAKVISKWDQYADDPAKERVLAWMRARDEYGRTFYKKPLQLENGRKPLLDLLQELLDGRAYGEQCLDLEVSPRMRQILERLVRDLDGMLYALAAELPKDISDEASNAGV
jgi:hypothetical protein